MTLGFSVTAGKRILIQQVQLAKQKGNRFLFKLPRNYLEFIIGRFRAQFPQHELFLVEGKSLTDVIMKGYVGEHRRQVEHLKEYRQVSASHRSAETRELYSRWAEEKEELAKRLTERMKHLRADKPRIISFYRDAGQFRLEKRLRVGGLAHRRLTA
jgi:hypothetical protein